MCGLAGFFRYKKRDTWMPDRKALETMTQSLSHRGPDDSGIFFDLNLGLGLGHRRLAIRDLSPLGAQPMKSSCGRFLLVYNGEIYSDKEILIELAASGRKPKGTSDTEILVEAFAEWGVEATLEKLNGMFAIAAFDNNTKTLHLIRDRIGIKPLYWGVIRDCIVFGSELKAFQKLKSWRPNIDRNSVASFMRHNYIPAPFTIYQKIWKLEPGTHVVIKENREPKIIKYWNFFEIAEQNSKNLYESDEETIVREVEKILLDSVSRRMVSDVPIGALLSGGIDSSTVTALMVESSPQRKINTFSIGFSEKGYDEAPYAKTIAKHLGTAHTELYAQPRDAMELIEKMPSMYDEPFADSSQIPTALVSTLTKRYVTVVLSGDGGDELFAGYNRYTIGYGLATKLNKSPSLLKALTSRCLGALPEHFLDRIGYIMPSKLRVNQLGQKIKKVAELSRSEDLDATYRSMISHWHHPNEIVLGSQEYKRTLWDENLKKRFPNFLDRMQAMDTTTYLPDDILTKVDRASMAVGLEARVPLLDHRLVEKSWKIPRDIKIFNGNSKWPLRKILYDRIPMDLVDRPKMGFGVPIDSWLRGPLKDWSRDLLDENRLKEEGFFNTTKITEKWQKHQEGENWAYPLWNVLMFQAWCSSFHKK